MGAMLAYDLAICAGRNQRVQHRRTQTGILIRGGGIGIVIHDVGEGVIRRDWEGDEF